MHTNLIKHLCSFFGWKNFSEWNADGLIYLTTFVEFLNFGKVAVAESSVIAQLLCAVAFGMDRPAALVDSPGVLGEMRGGKKVIGHVSDRIVFGRQLCELLLVGCTINTSQE